MVTGGDDILIDFDRRLLRADVGDATIKLSNFVFLRGGFAFEKSTDVSAPLVGGGTTQLDVVTIGTNNLHLFVGSGGPHWTDSNNDGVINGSDTPLTGAVGFAASGVSLAMFWAAPSDTTNKARYFAASATADSASLVGLGSEFTFSLSGLAVSVNQAIDSDGAITSLSLIHI